MTTIAQVQSALADEDLRARILIAAGMTGRDPGSVQANLTRLLAAPVTANGDTLATVHDYAAATYKPTLRPGANPAAVTDAMILAALNAIDPREAV